MATTMTGRDLMQEVIEATPGGEALRLCMQCGTCAGSCPSAKFMMHTPRRLFALINAGMVEEVLRSNTPWYCVSCYFCMVRCPMEIPITEIMYTLKRISLREFPHEHAEAQDWSERYMSFVEAYGRSFEVGLAARYHLTHEPLRKIGMGRFALELLAKDRLVAIPDRVKNMGQLRSLLEKASAMEGR
jgi:heterodisulfide reductase subunit C